MEIDSVNIIGVFKNSLIEMNWYNGKYSEFINFANSDIDYELYKEVYSNKQITGQIASYYLLINKQTNRFRQIPILRLSEFEYGITSELGYSLYILILRLLKLIF